MSSESLRTLERNLQNPQTQIEREIATLGPWFHNLHLPGEVQTAQSQAIMGMPCDVPEPRIVRRSANQGSGQGAPTAVAAL